MGRWTQSEYLRRQRVGRGVSDLLTTARDRTQHTGRLSRSGSCGPWALWQRAEPLTRLFKTMVCLVVVGGDYTTSPTHTHGWMDSDSDLTTSLGSRGLPFLFS